MNAFRLWVAEHLDISPELQTQIVSSLLVILALTILKRIATLIIRRSKLEPVAKYRWRKTIDYIVYILGIVIVTQVWVEQFSSITTFLGLFAAGVAIALKDPLLNLAGWLYLIWRKPFQVGDRIEIGQQAGDVIDIQAFQFSLVEIRNWIEADQPTGRIVWVPNQYIFTKPVANFNHELDFIFHEVPVILTFESNWRKAKELFYEVIERHNAEFAQSANQSLKRLAHRYLIPQQNMNPAVVTQVRENGIRLTLRIICPALRRRAMDEVLWEEVLDIVSSHDDLRFAYPTTRFVREEKSANNSQ